MSTFKKILSLAFPLIGAANMMIAGCSTEATTEESVGHSESALTAAQCSTFDINGKVQICHKTGSTNKPYTILRLSEQGCINGHVAHGGDYVTSTDPNSPLYDPTCSGGGCLPVSAPCDATLPCCDGSSCVNGTCQGTPPDPCDGVTCIAIDQCHTVGTCDSVSGACSSPAAADGSACDDGSGCTITDACSAGACAGSDDPCQNGSACSSNGGSYTCACPAGYDGSECQYDIDDCQEAEGVCANGDCQDLVNAYQCNCYAGWTGTNCDVPDVATCPCSGDASWIAGLAAVGSSACYANGTLSIGPSNWVDAGLAFCASGTQFDEWGDPDYSASTLSSTTPAQHDACVAEVQAACNPPPPPACGAPVFVYECDAANPCECGFAGSNCTTDIDECESTPCVNGQCTDGIAGYICACYPGFGGNQCECQL